jgi:hypothetical protein
VEDVLSRPVVYVWGLASQPRDAVEIPFVALRACFVGVEAEKPSASPPQDDMFWRMDVVLGEGHGLGDGPLGRAPALTACTGQT